VGDGLVCAREGEVLAASSRESGELVVGDKARASRGACPAGSWHGGEAQRVAWWFRGGAESWYDAWPELARGARWCDAHGMPGRPGRAKSGECRRPPRQVVLLGGVGECCGAQRHGGHGQRGGEERVARHGGMGRHGMAMPCLASSSRVVVHWLGVEGTREQGGGKWGNRV
jgi:hypothetical protein